MVKKTKIIFYSLFRLLTFYWTKVSPFALIDSCILSRKCAVSNNSRIYQSKIEEYSYIGKNCIIQHAEIGKFCSVGENCCIGLARHPIEWVSTSPVFHTGKNILKKNFANHTFHYIRKTMIGNDVWIGANVLIMPGVTIGNGVIIGAGSVITKDISSYLIVAGNPAKVIRLRFPEETCKLLEASMWWNYDEEKLAAVSKYFNDIDKFIEILDK